MKGRFAPSPTGYIHLGNVWIALLSYLSCKARGGNFVLRIEDIDTQRSKPMYAEALLDDLEWLGFTWDEGPRVGGPNGPYYQSERSSIYESYVTDALAKREVYPCFCNRARIQSIASAPHRGEVVHHYDGLCRRLTEAEREERWQQKMPSWRLAVQDTTISFQDSWAGTYQQNLQSGYDDFVIKRADAMWAYNWAVVIDDMLMGITEVVRGRDLLDSTALQVYLYQYFHHQPPQFKHAPLLVDVDGYRLSKRQASITVRELRQLGYTATQILGTLVVATGLVPSSLVGSSGIALEALREVSLDATVLREEQICIY